MKAKEDILDLGFGVVAHFAERYRELREKGKDLRNKLEGKVEEEKTHGREIRERLEDESAKRKQRLFNLLGVVSKQDIEELKAKLAEIERKLSEE